MKRTAVAMIAGIFLFSFFPVAVLAECVTTSISVGETINGVIDQSDCVGWGSYDLYTFSGTAGQQVAILMQSTAFDPWIWLTGPETSITDDNGGGGTSARIPAGSGYITLPSTGTYEIGAFSNSGFGSYTLSLTAPAACTYSISPTSASIPAAGGNGSISVTAPAGCAWTATTDNWYIVNITSGSSGTGNGTVNYTVYCNADYKQQVAHITVAGKTCTITQSSATVTPISIGETKNGSLDSSDCLYSFYRDWYSFSATAGQQVAIAMSSTAFDTYLVLYNPNGEMITINDNGGGGTNSRIPPTSGYYTLPSTGTYMIEASSAQNAATGAYTLSLTSPPCTYSISPTTVSLPAGGSGSVTTGLISVTAPAGCAPGPPKAMPPGLPSHQGAAAATVKSLMMS